MKKIVVNPKQNFFSKNVSNEEDVERNSVLTFLRAVFTHVPFLACTSVALFSILTILLGIAGFECALARIFTFK